MKHEYKMTEKDKEWERNTLEEYGRHKYKDRFVGISDEAVDRRGERMWRVMYMVQNRRSGQWYEASQNVYPYQLKSWRQERRKRSAEIRDFFGDLEYVRDHG